MVTPHERGSATIILLGVIAAAMIIFTAVVTVAKINLTVEAAQNVADLAALGAADSFHNQGQPPCPVAADIAQRNDPSGLFQIVCQELDSGNVSVCARGTYLGFPIQACGVAGPVPGQ